MSTAAEAIARFARTVELSIEMGIYHLAPKGRHVVDYRWTDDGRNTVFLDVMFDDGSMVRGEGPAKLEALADAEGKLG